MSLDTSYLTTQVNTIVGQLHGIFDEIGIPSHERQSRETELFGALSETLHNHLRAVNTEKTEMIEEAQSLIKIIKQMEASLDDDKTVGQYDAEDGDLRVSYPLNRCLSVLKEKHGAINKLYRERFEQVKKLVEALESYSSHLDPSFVTIALPPTSPGVSVPPTFDLSPSYVTALDNEFTKVYQEYNRRISLVRVMSEEIIKLWAELGTPQAQTDSFIVKYYKEAPEQLGLHEPDLANLKGKREKLLDEKKNRERRLKELKTAVESLWERLGIEERDRKAFLAANRGCGLRTINEFEEELARLTELKRQNLHLFVEDARCRLQELWDSLYYSEEEMLDFTPAFSDVYSDALLEAHEAEIVRLEALREQRAPTLQLVDKHRNLIEDRDSLAASSQDASRLMTRGNNLKGERRDPGKLLREEKMRKRITKELPKLEVDLKRALERWEDEYGRPFLVHGERYLDELNSASTKLPPRSKTPSGPPPSAKLISIKQPASTRGGNTIRGPPPSRSETKTPTGAGPNRRNPVPSSIITATAKSPSKIPARVPLGNMPHGNNSPERRMPPGSYSSNAAHNKVPPRAPPPKMRDLVVESREETPLANYAMEQSRCGSVMSSRSVRPISLEDVYDDRHQRAYLNSSVQSHRIDAFSHSSQSFQSSTSRDAGYPRENIYLQQNAPAPAMRQISNSSTIHTVTSGSENWETYDDASEPEVDASDVYYAKLRAAHGKRLATDDPQKGVMVGKKIKGTRNVGSEEMVEDGGQVLRIHGSDGGWTDDIEPY
ncbi:Microtubule associated protein (MAP65/ASE1 family) domain containing protein [Elaphomyces granulatus]